MLLYIHLCSSILSSFYLKKSKDKLEALEARRLAIEREEGIGQYLMKSPWSDEEEWKKMYFYDT